MKFKILLNRRRAAFLNDMFSRVGNDLVLMTTSDRQQDIINHLEIIRPHVFLILFDRESYDFLNTIKAIKETGASAGVLLMVAGESEDIEYFRQNADGIRADYVKLPLAVTAVGEHIVEYCKAHAEFFDNSEKLRLEQRADEIRKLETQQQRAEEREAEIKNRLKKQILVVDDDRNILKMMKAALEDDYDVTTIVNGTMALKYLESHTPDMMFLDYEMPLLTGAQVFARMRERKECEKIPVVFLTGVTDRGKIMEIMSLKPNGYLLKPVDIDDLTETLEKNLT